MNYMICVSLSFTCNMMIFFVCGTGAWVCKSWILKTVRDLSYKRVSGTENYGQIHCNACLFLL